MICHEIGHINQEQNLGKYTYEEQLIFKLENFLIESSLDFNKHYQKFHDNYYIEMENNNNVDSTNNIKDEEEEDLKNEDDDNIEDDGEGEEIEGDNDNENESNNESINNC